MSLKLDVLKKWYRPSSDTYLIPVKEVESSEGLTQAVLSKLEGGYLLSYIRYGDVDSEDDDYILFREEPDELGDLVSLLDSIQKDYGYAYFDSVSETLYNGSSNVREMVDYVLRRTSGMNRVIALAHKPGKFVFVGAMKVEGL